MSLKIAKKTIRTPRKKHKSKFTHTPDQFDRANKPQTHNKPLSGKTRQRTNLLISQTSLTTHQIFYLKTENFPTSYILIGPEILSAKMTQYHWSRNDPEFGPNDIYPGLNICKPIRASQICVIRVGQAARRIQQGPNMSEYPIKFRRLSQSPT